MIEEQLHGLGEAVWRDMSDAASLSSSICPIMRSGATRDVWYLWSLQVVATRGIDLGQFHEDVLASERIIGTMCGDFFILFLGIEPYVRTLGL